MPFHPWDVDEDQAKEIQLRLSKLVVLHDGFTSVGLVAGVSIRPVDLTTIRAAICIIDVPSMKTVDTAAAAKSRIPGGADWRLLNIPSVGVSEELLYGVRNSN